MANLAYLVIANKRTKVEHFLSFSLTQNPPDYQDQAVM